MGLILQFSSKQKPFDHLARSDALIEDGVIVVYTFGEISLHIEEHGLQ